MKYYVTRYDSQRNVRTGMLRHTRAGAISAALDLIQDCIDAQGITDSAEQMAAYRQSEKITNAHNLSAEIKVGQQRVTVRASDSVCAA